MTATYLFIGSFDLSGVFFKADSEGIARRLIGLLGRKFHDQAFDLTARSAADADEAILLDEQLDFVEAIAQCRDGDFGALDFPVSVEQKQLVELHWCCERWEAAIGDKAKQGQPAVGPCYVVRCWFDEGYTGDAPVYLAPSLDVATELARAADVSFGSNPQDAVECGASEWFAVRSAAEAVSRIAWDTELHRIAEEARAGKLEGDAKIFAACEKWATVIAGGVPNLGYTVIAPSQIDPSQVVAAADVFLAGIWDYANCVTTAGDHRDPEKLYLPLEESGYLLLRAGSAWEKPMPELDRLLLIARQEGLPLGSCSDYRGSYDQWQRHRKGEYLTSLRTEVYAVRHAALIRVPVQSISRAASPPATDDPRAMDAGDGDGYLVNLNQAAAIVGRSKKTLERYLGRMPPPHIQGGGGKPSLWKWGALRPWLEAEFVPDLPACFPREKR